MSEEQTVNGCLVNDLSQALKQKSQADHEAGEQGCSSPVMRCDHLLLHAYILGIYCKIYKTCST